MPAGKGKSNHGGTKALWDDFADDIKEQASKMDACPFSMTGMLSVCGASPRRA